MPDFFAYYYLTTAGSSQEEKNLTILGLMTGLKVQLALLEKDQFIYNGFWMTELRKNFSKPIGVVIRQRLADWEDVLDESMFPGWKEVRNNTELDSYLLRASVGAQQVTSLYDVLVRSSQFSSTLAKESVAKTVKCLLGFLEKEYKFS